MKKILFLCVMFLTLLFTSCAGRPQQSPLDNTEQKTAKTSRIKDKMVVNGAYSYAGMSVGYVLLEDGKILVFSSATKNPLSVSEAGLLFSSGVTPGCDIKTSKKENGNVDCFAVFKGAYSYASVDVVYVLYKNGKVCHFGSYTKAPFTDEEAKILLMPIGSLVTYYE